MNDLTELNWYLINTQLYFEETLQNLCVNEFKDAGNTVSYIYNYIFFNLHVKQLYSSQ